MLGKRQQWRGVVDAVIGIVGVSCAGVVRVMRDVTVADACCCSCCCC